MPIYEYHCEKCDATFEQITFRGDEEDVCCPTCGGKEVKRLMSASRFMGASGLGSCAAGSTSGFS